MRRLKNLQQMLPALILLTAVLLLTQEAAGQPSPPLKASLAFSKASFKVDDPADKIGVIITLQNTTGQDVWTEAGFEDKRFQLFLLIKGPGEEGRLIVPNTGTAGVSQTPLVPPSRVKVQRLAAGWFINVPIDDLKSYFTLTEPGVYEVWFSMPFVRYDGLRVEPVDSNSDGTADYYQAPPEAVIWFEPITSAPAFVLTLVKSTPAKTADIRVQCTEFVFGEGSRPPVTKQPLTLAEVRLYQASEIAAAGISTINNKTYPAIAANSTITYRLAAETATPGLYGFKRIDQGDYVVIVSPSTSTAYRGIGQSILANNRGWDAGEIVVDMILMTTKGGKKTPGKSTRVTGSELIMVQPEYVEWDSAEQFYPFAFETADTWEVDVALTPPPGFAADNKSLKETVTSGLKALQFKLTDVAANWKPTKVKYKLKYNKKAQEFDDEIGVRLSKDLAKKKGVGIWGE